MSESIRNFNFVLHRKAKEQKLLNETQNSTESKDKINSGATSTTGTSAEMDTFEPCNDYESACRRNQALLKKLEMAKARLRSRAAYSPVMTQLTKLKKLYANKLAEQQQPNFAGKSTDHHNNDDHKEYNSSEMNSSSTPTRLKKIYGPTFI